MTEAPLHVDICRVTREETARPMACDLLAETTRLVVRVRGTLPARAANPALRRYPSRMRYAGRCHCGNIEVAFEPTLAASELQLRECACSFCRRHGAAGVSDPGGHLELTLRAPAEVSRYRFGLRTAEFLVCRACGVYVAAVCAVDGVTYAVLNANVLEERAAFTRPPVRVDFDGEAAAERMARRSRSWTPATVHDA